MIDEGTCRQDRVRGAGFQADMAVSIRVLAELDDVFGQHLDHADFAGPGARGVPWVQISVLNHLDRSNQLGPEEFRPAAVVCERGERVDRIEVALNSAKVGFKCPKSGDDRRWDAIFALNTVKYTGVFLHVGSAVFHAVAGDHALGKIQERHLEDALRPVARQDLPVNLRTGECLICGTCGQAFGNGFLFHAGKECLKITATLLGRSRGSHQREACQRGNCKCFQWKRVAGHEPVLSSTIN